MPTEHRYKSPLIKAVLDEGEWLSFTDLPEYITTTIFSEVESFAYRYINRLATDKPTKTKLFTQLAAIRPKILGAQSLEELDTVLTENEVFVQNLFANEPEVLADYQKMPFELKKQFSDDRVIAVGEVHDGGGEGTGGTVIDLEAYRNKNGRK